MRVACCCPLRAACCCSAALRRPPAVARAQESGASPRRFGLVRTITAEWMRLLRAAALATLLPNAEPARDKVRHPPRGAVLTLTVHRATPAGNGRHCDVRFAQ